MKEKKKRKLGISFFIIIVVLLVLTGAIFYHFNDNLSWVDSFYFTVMTIMTVGYGDFRPTNEASKIFTIIFGIVSIPTVLFVFGWIIESFFVRRINKLETEVDKVTKEEELVLNREKLIIEKENEILDKEK